MSRPAQFLIETGGYKLPTAAGVPWIITQGPYGTFSHWGNSLHAFDIAPRGGKLRGGDEGGDRVHARSGTAAGSPASFVRKLRHHRPRQRRVQPLRASGHRHVCGEERRARGAGAGARDRWKQRLYAGRRRRLSRARQRDAGASDFVLERSVPVRGSAGLVAWQRLSDRGLEQCIAAVRLRIASDHCKRGRGRSSGASSPDGQFSGTVSVAQWWSEVIAVSEDRKSWRLRFRGPARRAIWTCI